MVTGDIRISVALVSYNGAKYLRQQLDSILCQLGEQDELVISDDGSTDGTVQLIEEYQSRDSRVRLLTGPGQGIKKNVEHVLSHTRGLYIFLADQDDIWLEGKVDSVLWALRRQAAAVVVHDAKVFADDDSSDICMESFYEFRNSGPGVIKNIVKNSYIGCCMAVRCDLLEKILPIPAQIEMHDQWIGILADAYAGGSYFLSEPLLLYRRHGGNNSSMEHYGLWRMLRNRVVFVCCLCRRLLRRT